MNIYTVQQGDSLWGIIKSNSDGNISNEEIAQKIQEVSLFNNIDNASNINIGQEIDLSCLDDTAQVEEQPIEEQSETPKEEIQDTTKESSEQTASPQTYTVQKGDNLWKIAKNYFGDSVSEAELSQKINELSSYNNIANASNISVGQEIDFSCFEPQNSVETVEDTTVAKQEVPAEEEASAVAESEVQEPVLQEEPTVITEPEIEEEAEEEAKQNSTNNTTSSEISFHRGTPSDYEYETEALQQRAEQMWENTQSNALQNDIHRSAPTFDENGTVIANSEYYESDTTGDLSGITVMVNAGHGGFDPAGTTFDPGAVNEECGAEEWAINQDYAEDLTGKLLDEGANVLVTSGNYKTLKNAVNQFAQDYGEGDNSNLKLVSIHCNAGSSTAEGVVYFNSDGNNTLNNDLNEAAQESEINVNGVQQHNTNIGQAANANNIDNSLVEIGFLSNPNDLAKMQDENYKNTLLDSIVDGVINNVNE